MLKFVNIYKPVSTSVTYTDDVSGTNMANYTGTLNPLVLLVIAGL